MIRPSCIFFVAAVTRYFRGRTAPYLIRCHPNNRSKITGNDEVIRYPDDIDIMIRPSCIFFVADVTRYFRGRTAPYLLRCHPNNRNQITGNDEVIRYPGLH